MASKIKTPPFVAVFVSERGHIRTRFRKQGCRPCYLPTIGTPEFWVAYEAAKANTLASGGGRLKPRSVADLLARWFATNAFKKSGATRQARAKSILEPFREKYAADLVAAFKWNYIETLLEERAEKRRDETTGRMVGGTAAANNLKKELWRAFNFAELKLEWISRNPVDGADSIDHQVVGFHNWTDEEIDQFRAFHRIGTMARAALEIMLWTAQRGGDAHTFGPQHMKGDRIEFAPAKQQRKGVIQYFDAPPALLEAIRALATTGTTAFLLTSFGKPFASAKAFQNKVREWCDDAGLEHCSAHGLRKAAARRAAENGATQQEIKAIGGWSSDKAAAPYLEAADKAKLAKSGTAKVVQFEAERARANG